MTRFGRFGKRDRPGESAGDAGEIASVSRGGTGTLAAMTTTPALHVERVLPARADLTVGEVDAILEAAYLATIADGTLSEDEYEAFRTVASSLRGLAAGAASPLGDGEMAKLIERYSVLSDHAARQERIVLLREHLERPMARDIAYKVAFAMSLCDLDANDEEREYEDELVEAFGIADERADELAAEVYAALDADLDRDSEHP